MTIEFAPAFKALTEHEPFRWQERLFQDFCAGQPPLALDLPTGLGKTSVMAVWLIARALAEDEIRRRIPRRLVYVVDRRAVVDQATAEAGKIRCRLGDSGLDLARLGLEEKQLPISTLRGQYADNRDWLADPVASSIIVGTVDMIGSRLLFQGYGVSMGMRPIHAAFLGTDALIVLDEAHLVPPFEALLRTIARDPEQKLWPRAEPDENFAPCMRLMSLSATAREDKDADGTIFRLAQEDEKDSVVVRRLNASKRVKLEDVEPGDLVKEMAKRAWERGEGGRKVIVFCNSRGVAQDVYENLKKKFKDDLKVDLDKDAAKAAQHLELIVGARRVRERERLAESFVFRRFAHKLAKEEKDKEKAAALAMPAFLVATSAGEVGVDIDADHMVCDLVAWERMVQRLGRVNRLGDFAEGSLVDVFAVLSDKEAENPAGSEELKRWRKPFESPEWRTDKDGRRDASPGALLRLRENKEFKELCHKATTEPPLHPRLTRELLDAWSMTSLKEHPGRPEIQPWLRGWEKDDRPQTKLIWRRDLPVRRGELEDVAKAELNEFLDDAPPHISEILEDRTDAVVKWLETRAKALLKPRRSSEDESTDEPLDTEAGERLDPLQPDSIAAIVLTPGNEVESLMRLEEIGDANGRRLYAIFAGRTVIVGARLGGLDSAGLLDPKAGSVPPTLDGGPDAKGGWDDKRLQQIGFRVDIVRRNTPPKEGWQTSYWRLVNAEREESGDLDVAYEWRVEVWRGDGSARGDMAISRKDQSLVEHTDEVVAAVGKIADALGLDGPYRQMLVEAARCHDSGKARANWQRYAGNPLFARDPKKYLPLAKFSKRGNPDFLKIGDKTYRHEFGSLRDAMKDDILRGIADESLRELALHLVAAHHGNARPVIASVDPDAAPSASIETACQAALRFAEMQKQWSPWGLAWLESLLRAADMAASRAHDRRGVKAGGEKKAEKTEEVA